MASCWPRRKGSRKRDGCPSGTSQPQRAAVRGTEAGSETGAAQAERGFEDSKDRSQGPHLQQCSCWGYGVLGERDDTGFLLIHLCAHMSNSPMEIPLSNGSVLFREPVCGKNPMQGSVV